MKKVINNANNYDYEAEADDEEDGEQRAKTAMINVFNYFVGHTYDRGRFAVSSSYSILIFGTADAVRLASRVIGCATDAVITFPFFF